MKLNYLLQNKKFHFGECDQEVYRITKRALEKGITDFSPVKGLAWFAVGPWTEPDEEDAHSWIEKDGEIIDPTINQFQHQIDYLENLGIHVEFKDLTYKVERKYKPLEYVEEFERLWPDQAQV